MPAEPAEPEAPPEPPPAEPEHLTLAADFPAATADEWRAAAVKALTRSGYAEDVDPVEALSFTTYDGITIKPLYVVEDTHPVDDDGAPGQAPFVRGAGAVGAEDGPGGPSWDVRARHADPDPARSAAAVLEDLERGATSLWLVLGDAGIAVADLPAVLDGVQLDLAPVVLDAGTETAAALAAVLDLAAAKDVEAVALRGSIGADPIGTRARTGAPAELGLLAELVRQRGEARGLRVATVDATVYHEAGASDAQEIGLATAVGVAYLRALVDSGLDVTEALAALEFRLAVTAEQFPSIAKLRAARRVWDRVAELCGAGDDRAGQAQHAVTSAAMLARRDPWVNMLRATVGCFAAAVGGAGAITVLPFDAALGLPDDLARRLARNTQAVLHDESSLGRVLDAAGGSWFVESLTDELAQAAWTVFTDLERPDDEGRGGVLARLDDGAVAAMLDGVQQRRADDIAHRRAPITGVSEFAFVDEQAVERPPAPQPDRSGALLPRVRYAQDFEALRDAADAAPERPTVFLAGLGPLATTSTRAGFAANLFQSAGITCVRASGDLDEVVAEYRTSGTPVVCLCSTDKVYADDAVPAAEALRGAGATQVWLAGQGDYDGVDGTLYAGCDALAVLRSTFETLGVDA